MKLSEESARAEAECMMNLRQGKVIPERQVPREKDKIKGNLGRRRGGS